MSQEKLKNALLVTVVGSIIVLIGQLAGTIFPITYGSYDFSDFYISVNQIVYSLDGDSIGELYMNPSIQAIGFEGEIYSHDLHPFLRPYQSMIYLRALDAPNDTDIIFSPSRIRPGDKSKMTIIVSRPQEYGKTMDTTSWLRSQEYPIVIQGFGENGKKRNVTIVVSLTQNKESEKEQLVFWPQKNEYLRIVQLSSPTGKEIGILRDR